MALPPPATGVELYLEAILDELRALRVAVGDRALARFVDERINEALVEVAKAVQSVPADLRPESGPIGPEAVKAASSPTKRTRARTPR